MNNQSKENMMEYEVENVILGTYTLDGVRRILGELLEDPILKTKYKCVAGLKDLLRKNGISLSDACNAIRQMGGNRAMVIYGAKVDGWWIGDAVADIRVAPGNRAWAIYRMETRGWWVGDAVAEIRVAPGNRDLAIRLAKRGGWWDDKNEEATIMSEPKWKVPVESIELGIYDFHEFKRILRTLLEDPILETECKCIEGMKDLLALNGIILTDWCDMIRRMGGNRALFIYFAKASGWWIGDACTDIRNAPGNRAWVIIFAKMDGWWEGEDE